MMNTAMKLLLSNNWVRMNVAKGAEEKGAGGAAVDDEVETDANVDTSGDVDEPGDDVDWLLNDDETPETVVDKKVSGEEEIETEEPENDKKGDETEEVEDPEKKDESVEPEKSDDKKDETKESEAPEAMTPEKIAEAKEKFRAELEKSFAISEEDANLLVTAPEQVLPRLASNISMQILEQVQIMQNQMIANLPQMIMQSQAQSTNEQKLYDEFMASTPELSQMDAKELNEAVNELAPIVKKRFPTLTPQERMVKLGMLIKNTYGLKDATPPKKAEPAPKARTPKPHTPTAPAQSSVPAGNRKPTKLEAEIEELLNSDDD
jgi:hypothetical protein